MAQAEAKKVRNVEQAAVAGRDDIGQHQHAIRRHMAAHSAEPCPELLRRHVLDDAVDQDEIEGRTLPTAPSDQ